MSKADPTSTPPPLPSVEVLRAIVAKDRVHRTVICGTCLEDRRTLLALVGALREALTEYFMGDDGTGWHESQDNPWEKRARELLALCDAAGSKEDDVAESVTPLPPLGDEEIAEMSRCHHRASRVEDHNWCARCGQVFPCDASRLLAERQAQGERIAALEAEAAQEETWQHEAEGAGEAWAESRAQVVSLTAQLVERDARIASIDAEMSRAIGSVRFMDPPDGGCPTHAEQVTRMREALTVAEAKLAEVERERDVLMRTLSAV